MTDTTKGASTIKTWQTPVLVSLDSGLNGVLNTINAPQDDTGTFSQTSGNPV